MGGAQPLAVTMNDGVADRRRRPARLRAPDRAPLPGRDRRRPRPRPRAGAGRQGATGAALHRRARQRRRALPGAARRGVADRHRHRPDQRPRPAGLPAGRRRLRRHGRLRRREAGGLHRAGPRVDGQARRGHGRLHGRRAPRSSTTATPSAARPSSAATSAPSTSPASSPPTSGRCSARARARSAGPRCPATRPTSPRPTRRCWSSSRRTSPCTLDHDWPGSGSTSRACPRASAGSATASATRPASAFNDMVADGRAQRAARHRPRPPRLRLGGLARTARPRRCSTAPTRSPTGRCSTPWSTSPPAPPGSPSTTAAASASAAPSTPARSRVADGTELAAQKIARVLTNDPGHGRHPARRRRLRPRRRGRRRARRPHPDAGERRLTDELTATFHAMWAELAAPRPRPATGGYRRYAWTAPTCRCATGSPAQARAAGWT